MRIADPRCGCTGISAAQRMSTDGMFGVCTGVVLVNAVEGMGRMLRNLSSAVPLLLISDGYPTFITVCVPTVVLPITDLLSRSICSHSVV